VGGDESWIPILHPDDLQLCLDQGYRAVQSGELYEIEYRFLNDLAHDAILAYSMRGMSTSGIGARSGCTGGPKRRPWDVFPTRS
jgi:hypothetical protein